MAAVQEVERAHGLVDLTRGPDFGLSNVVQMWADGDDFDTILSRTALAPGDLVRVLRMTIQLLRQAYHALPGGDPVARTLRDARMRLDRDVVDARRQLELG
jgi:superfamily II RNA helicase